MHYSSKLTVTLCFCSIFFFTYMVLYSFCLCFWGGTGEKQIRSVSAKTCLVTKACSGGRLLGDMREETKVEKDKRTFFQVCFSFSTPPEAQSFYELSGLFLKSVGLSALQKQHRLPKKLEGRVVFFLSSFSFSFLFKNSENYSKSSPFLCPLPLHPLVPPPLPHPLSWSFPADKHGSE